MLAGVNFDFDFVVERRENRMGATWSGEWTHGGRVGRDGGQVLDDFLCVFCLACARLAAVVCRVSMMRTQLE